MSARTDTVRQSLERGFDPEVFRKIGTEDMTFYAAHLGIDVQGRDAVADALGKVFTGGAPTFQVHGDPVEQGNFVVVFYRATLSTGEEREICGVFRFADDDRVSGAWTMRG
jgi:hypothetical protein